MDCFILLYARQYTLSEQAHDNIKDKHAYAHVQSADNIAIVNTPVWTSMWRDFSRERERKKGFSSLSLSLFFATNINDHDHHHLNFPQFTSHRRRVLKLLAKYYDDDEPEKTTTPTRRGQSHESTHTHLLNKERHALQRHDAIIKPHVDFDQATHTRVKSCHLYNQDFCRLKKNS